MAMPVNFGRWVIGFIAVICGLAALFIASGAEQPIMYYTAIFFFIGAVLFIFGLIKQSYDALEGH
jgi:predicted membrane channel-forming protein YqfA (hemolysin III family)